VVRELPDVVGELPMSPLRGVCGGIFTTHASARARVNFFTRWGILNCVVISHQSAEARDS
jgi:hypothetical protein